MSRLGGQRFLTGKKAVSRRCSDQVGVSSAFPGEPCDVSPRILSPVSFEPKAKSVSPISPMRRISPVHLIEKKLAKLAKFPFL